MKISGKFLALLAAGTFFMGSAQAAVVETPNGAVNNQPEISVMLPGQAHDNGFM